MTEAEWLACGEPEEMFTWLRNRSGHLTVRKGRLFCCACCRRIWHLLFPQAGAAVEVAERHADRLATDGELESADGVAADTIHDPADYPEAQRTHGLLLKYCDRAVANCCLMGSPDEEIVAYNVAFALDEEVQHSCPAPPPGETPDRARYKAELSAQCDLLRDICGNPFYPIVLAPTWLTPPVRSLAQAAYGRRSLPDGTLALDRLAVLADALEEAGCIDPAILSHLRGPGPHVRGCWCVDLVLSKE